MDYIDIIKKQKIEYVDIQDLYNEAIDLVENNDYKTAIKKLNEVLTVQHNSTVYCFLGVIYANRLNEPDIATDYYKKALELGTDIFIPYLELGNVAIINNRFEVAKAYLTKAYHLYPSKETIYRLGYNEFKNDNYEKAIEYFEKAFKEIDHPSTYIDKSTNKNLLLNYAGALRKLKKYTDAIELYKELIARFPDRIFYVIFLIATYNQMKDYKLALEILDDFISTDRYNNCRLYLEKAQIYELYLDDPINEMKCYENAIELMDETQKSEIITKKKICQNRLKKLKISKKEDGKKTTSQPLKSSNIELERLFPDDNFKLAIIESIRSNNLGNLSFDKRFDLDLIEEETTKTHDIENPNQEIRQVLVSTIINKSDLEAVTRVDWLGGEEIQERIWMTWSGECDYFNINSLRGVEYLTNLEEINIELHDIKNFKPLLECKNLKKVRFSFYDVDKELNEDNKLVFNKLRERNAEITFS